MLDDNVVVCVCMYVFVPLAKYLRELLSKFEPNIHKQSLVWHLNWLTFGLTWFKMIMTDNRSKKTNQEIVYIHLFLKMLT